ncbi:MAG TPA: PDZ domain-containing protein [Terriglobales bacterium]|nr:PDZ domain-containing protein [Terriglobales bacterium]
MKQSSSERPLRRQSPFAFHQPLLIAALLGWSALAWAGDSRIEYRVSLANPEQHLIRVQVKIPPGAAAHELQLPVWNALYQVRDFSQYMNWIRARSTGGKALPLRVLNKSAWQVGGTELGVEIEYEMFANQPGPFGAQLNEHHAFFNLAEILMYPADARGSAMAVDFSDLPRGWRVVTTLHGKGTEFTAESYDRMVDSPVEIGTFQESHYDQGGSHYRVVVDANPADFDMEKIVATVESITRASTEWMDDRPFDTYTFLYHFPRGPAGGGMEHAYSTAIDVNAQELRDRPQALADVTAHELFHLWNVKRIRPRSLEPIDYTKENYTRALWFSEGVTSTAADYIELRAGLITMQRFLDELADEIGELQRRPAHLTQSAEQSSLDAWLEKYAYYREPDRSISYYNKGLLLGVMLDLAVREGSHGSASLRELFQWMNQNYAKQGKYFDDSAGVRGAAESVCHCDLQPFFEEYVAGTEEIPWDDFLRAVGLHLVKENHTQADPGFTLTRNFDAPPSVLAVKANTDAARAGLAAGDEILEVNGQSGDPKQAIELLRPGDMLKLRIRRHGQERELQWRTGSQEEVEYELKNLEHVTPEQSARRAAWLKGEAEGEMRH